MPLPLLPLPIECMDRDAINGKGIWCTMYKMPSRSHLEISPTIGRAEGQAILDLFEQPIAQTQIDRAESARSLPSEPSVHVLMGPDLCSQSLLSLLTKNQSALAVGEARNVLTMLPSCVAQTCITSPPYWSLRDYNIDGQIGLEDSVEGYIERLVSVFAEVRRVLRDDGTLWLNIGDSYTSGGRTWRAPDKKNPIRAMDVRPATPIGLKPKDLIGIPWRIAMALQAAGWYLRTDIIWNKPNCQPESVKDRPTRSHEYIFLFSKSEKYYYDGNGHRGQNNRNLRTVWDIRTQPYSEAHFATFPPALVQPCIALGSKVGSLVLDPFVGSGTTGEVAIANGRPFIGIDLNPDYIGIARRRLKGVIIEK